MGLRLDRIIDHQIRGRQHWRPLDQQRMEQKLPPSLSNAERQRRFRERRKSQLEDNPGEVSRLREENAQLRAVLRSRCDEPAASLTPEQEEKRKLLIADLLSDRSWGKLSRRQQPQFMEMSRETWMAAQPELLEHFGLTKVVETARRIMQLDLHTHHIDTGRRYRTSKRHTAAFGR
jgi:hypothetical protein